MIRYSRLYGLVAVLPLAGCHHAPATLTPDASGVTTIRDAGFNQPENIAYDSVADVFLVSNMGGGDAASDDNGFISRVAPDGRVLQLRWIAGGVNGAVLDAPKGIAIHGETLAVADLGGVHLFDRRTGGARGTIAVRGLVMNDLAFADDGSLWITDSGPDRTTTPVDTSKDVDAVWHAVPRRGVTSVARGLELGRPDGITVDGTGAVVSTFGASRLERVGGGTSGSWSTVASLPAGKLDGLRRLPDGTLVVTSWEARTVWHLDASMTPHAIITGVESPAGVALDTRRGRLAVTSMNGNALYLLHRPLVP
jgi:sugar lactone lactonase YvrE